MKYFDGTLHVILFSLVTMIWGGGGGGDVGVLIHWTEEYKEVQILEILKSILTNQLLSKSVFICN